MSAGDNLEKDLSWRESELASLKLATRHSPESEVRGRAARRAYVAMLYAHYEGFSKFAFKTYLISISQRRWPIENLSPQLQKLFMTKNVRDIRNLPVLDFLPAIADIQHAYKGTSVGDYPFPQTSNLWPNIFKDFCNDVGLRSDFLDEKRSSIGNLVGTRNGIAHGQELYVSDEKLRDLENAAWHVMIGLSLSVVDNLAEGRFLNL